ncbi:MAG: flippase-like domain-containing protein [Oscillospiraceae bacterium]|jgi:uncharacterized protein (TIRG00374 family)|nr:flippase-like domain-containing protein [Oscillospiraceae bacterium]
MPLARTVKRFTPKLSFKWFNLASLLVAAAVLCAVVLGNQGVAGLFSRWRQLNPRWLLAAGVCILAYWLLEAVALHTLTGCLYRGVPFRSTLRTAIIGQLYSALTPFSSGGQPVQLIYMQRDGLDTGGAGAVLTVKSIAYQVGVMLFGLAAALASYAYFHALVPAFLPVTIIGFGANMLVTGGMLLLALNSRATRKLTAGVLRLLHALRIVRDIKSATEKSERQFAIFHEGTRRYNQRRGALLGVMGITVLQLFALYAVPFAIYRAFGGSDPLLVHIVAAVAYVSMASAFVPLPGGSGGAEGGFLLFFGVFFAPSDLLIALLLWRLITYYSNILVGALTMLISRKRQRACVRLPQ